MRTASPRRCAPSSTVISSAAITPGSRMGRWSGPDNPAALRKVLPVAVPACLLGVGISFAARSNLAGAFEAVFGAEPIVSAITLCLLRALAAALPFVALMLLYQWLRGRRGLGMGDVKLAAVAGAWLDWVTIAWVIEAGAMEAIITFLVWRYLLRRQVTATTRLPFGLFLAPAIWLGWVAQTIMATH